MKESRNGPAFVYCLMSIDIALRLLSQGFIFFRIIGATSLVFSYLGEFLSIKYRDQVLCKLEIFWSVGMILLPSKCHRIAYFNIAGISNPLRGTDPRRHPQLIRFSIFTHLTLND